MNTAKIFKEEVSNPNIWKLMLIDLGLHPDTVSSDSEKTRKESQNRSKKQ